MLYCIKLFPPFHPAPNHCVAAMGMVYPSPETGEGDGGLGCSETGGRAGKRCQEKRRGASVKARKGE